LKVAALYPKLVLSSEKHLKYTSGIIMFQQGEEPTKIVTTSRASELQFILLEHKTQDFIKTTAGNCICKLMQ
jgi:hypothetical protein